MGENRNINDPIMDESSICKNDIPARPAVYVRLAEDEYLKIHQD